MNMDSRIWRFAYWLMAWAPFIVFLFGPDDWGVWKEVAVSAAVVGGLFILSLVVILVNWVVTGREPDFETSNDGDRGPIDVPSRTFTEPASNVRRLD